MNHPPIRRDPALIPFSRDHHTGLVLARRLIMAARGRGDPDGAWRTFRSAWDSELADHFEQEERLLMPLCPDPALNDRLVREHAALREAAQRHPTPPLDQLERIGQLLHDHIRWEERTYFNAIESNLTAQNRQALSARTQAMEARRPRSR